MEADGTRLKQREAERSRRKQIEAYGSRSKQIKLQMKAEVSRLK